MLADIYTGHVARIVPGWFAGHVVGNDPAVDSQILKTNIPHFPARIITTYHRYICIQSIIRNILEQDILDTLAGGFTILLIVENPDIDQLPFAEILDPDILERDVPDDIVVSSINSKTALIVQLPFLMVKNVVR